MNARITLHSLLLLSFVFAVPAFVTDRVADARDTNESTQVVMQAGLPLGTAPDAATGAPAFDIEAVPASREVAFEVRTDEVVVTATGRPA